MTRAQNALERVLSQRSKDGQRTAVPVVGNGLNIQAALEAGVDPADDWPVMLRGIAKEMRMGSEEFDQLPDSAPLSWDALVEWKARADRCTLEDADSLLKQRLASQLTAAEERTKALPLYGRVLAAGFENIVSLSIDRRLALHSGQETLVTEKEGWRPSVFDRHSSIPHADGRPARIWYPHGDSALAGCIRLGTLDHTWMLRDLEDRRAYLITDWSESVRIGWSGPEGGSRMGVMRRQLRPPKRYYEMRRSFVSSWYDLFFLAPLIFIGAQLPLEEWPIWWLLHQRARNYVPFPRSAAQPTFYLTAAGVAKRHLEGQPCDIEVVEFPSHDDMWAFVLRAG
jgi:hypothetical protein